MDPRHPELAISRMRELMEQYDRIEKDMNEATTSAQLGQLEREGGLVVQEICLVAPRIHEAMMQTSRQRRHDLAHGALDEPQDTLVENPMHKWSGEERVAEAKEYLESVIEETVENPVEKVPEIASEGVLEVIGAAKKNAEVEGLVEKPAQSVTEQPTEPTQSVEKTEVKPKKKTTRKKKTAKKAEK